MNCGLSNLTALKNQILAPGLAVATDFDSDIQMVGLAVAGAFDSNCNRKFAFLADEQETVTGDRSHWYVNRFPFISFSKIELQFFRTDAWTDISGQPVSQNPSTGLVHFGFTLGRSPLMVRLTYSGGYFFETLEAADPGYPSVKPDGATALPTDLQAMFFLQCKRVWESLDKIGDKISEVGPGEKGGRFELGIGGLELAPIIKNFLSNKIRYQVT